MICKSYLYWRLRFIVLAFIGFVGANGAYGADTLDSGTLTMSSLQIGGATYSNVVNSIGRVYSIGNAPAVGTQDVYDPSTRRLTIPSFLAGGVPYYNFVLTVGGLISVGSVAGADSLIDGGQLTISSVLVGSTTYTNVVVTLYSLVDILGGMPNATQDSYDSSGQLSIPAVQVGNTVYTNVIVTIRSVISVGGSSGGGGGASIVTGNLVGPVPVGTQTVMQNQATLQNNGGDDLTSTVTQLGTNSYDKTSFTFPTQLFSGAAYSVSILTPPAGQTCSVFSGGSGTMPMTANSLWVGCETINDDIARSTDNSYYGNYSGTTSPMLGGSNTAVGGTVTAYGEGRYAVFLSYRPGITSNALGNSRQVFWRDRYTGQTLLVSATVAGVEANSDSYNPVISADGQTVAFESSATNLVAGDTSAASDIFVWSARAPSAGVTRVSVGLGGVESTCYSGTTPAASNNPSLSGDGKIIVFESNATNLDPAFPLTGGSTTYIYRRDLTTNTTKLISVDNNGVGRSGHLPILSEDGKRMVFESYDPLVASDNLTSLWDIYLYDDTTVSLTRVSMTSTGGEKNQGSDSASSIVASTISGNGRYVAYETSATNIVPGGTTVGLVNLYVVDTIPVNGVMPVTLASVSSNGVQANSNTPDGGESERPSFSYDGQWIAFASAATNLDSSASSGTKVFIHNNFTGETRALTASANFGVAGPVSMSRTGAYVAYWTGAYLDSRFAAPGLFATFTGLQKAFFWTTGTLP